jgi:hypothetical protein
MATRKTTHTGWTQELRWHDIAQSAVIMGVVPDFSRGSMKKLNAFINNLPNVKKRKEGTGQSSPVYYKAKIR